MESTEIEISAAVTARPLLWFTYEQSNINGFYKVDGKIGHYVIVQATDRLSADAAAGLLGVDFSDCCECCGGRWMPDGAGSDAPEIWGVRADAWKSELGAAGSRTFSVVEIHTADGRQLTL